MTKEAIKCVLHELLNDEVTFTQALDFLTENYLFGSRPKKEVLADYKSYKNMDEKGMLSNDPDNEHRKRYEQVKILLKDWI